MRSPRILAAAGTVAAAALVLTACTPGGGSSESGSPDADATVNVGLVLEPTDLDIRTIDSIRPLQHQPQPPATSSPKATHPHHRSGPVGQDSTSHLRLSTAAP